MERGDPLAPVGMIVLLLVGIVITDPAHTTCADAHAMHGQISTVTVIRQDKVDEHVRFSADGRTIVVESMGQSTPDLILASTTCEYDDRGRIHEEKRSRSNTVTTYSYDSRGRLSRIVTGSPDVNGRQSTEITYRRNEQTERTQTQSGKETVVKKLDDHGRVVLESGTRNPNQRTVYSYDDGVRVTWCDRGSDVMICQEKRRDTHGNVVAYGYSDLAMHVSAYEYDSVGNWIRRSTTLEIDGKPSDGAPSVVIRQIEYRRDQ